MMNPKEYRQPRCPHGWVDVTQCEPCKTAAERDALQNEIDHLRSALAQQHTPFGYVQYVDKFGDYEFNKLKKDCRNDREAIPVYTAPQAQQPLTWWQPIDTAPEETEVFIGRYIDGVFKFGRSELFYDQACEFDGETFSGWVWSEDDCDSSIAESPTHWMPIPPAANGIGEKQ